MKKKHLFLLVALIIIPYIIFPFYGSIQKAEYWANFGTYINGVLSPFIALSVGYLTYIISNNQAEHKSFENEKERNAQRPLVTFEYTDYPDMILVEITNKGLGPMHIIKYGIQYKENTNYQGFFSLLKAHQLEGMFSLYTESINGFALSSNEHLKLFEITRQEIIHNILADDENMAEGDITHDDIEEYLNEIRNLFSSCTLHVEFEDIYKNQCPIVKRDMTFFSRNIELANEA